MSWRHYLALGAGLFGWGVLVGAIVAFSLAPARVDPVAVLHAELQAEKTTTSRLRDELAKERVTRAEAEGAARTYEAWLKMAAQPHGVGPVGEP